MADGGSPEKDGSRARLKRMRCLIKTAVDDRRMTGFYKAELPSDAGQWEETTIVERLGTPEEHEDRFWRKGPYGIEQSRDGTFEAYVLVSSTPFRIGGGFESFDEAVMFLTSSMESKTVPDSPEEKTEQEDAEMDREKAPPAPVEADEGEEDAEPAEDADEPSEAVEKACDGDVSLGPEANGVGKSEDFEKGWAGDPAGTDTEEINDAIDDGLRQAHLDRANRGKDIGELYSGSDDERINSHVNNAQYSDAHPAPVYGHGYDPNTYVIAKSDDDGIEHHEDVDLPSPEEVNERHYIDNHTLGRARLMADAPSLEAFERSVGDFRSLMASKNMDGMYLDLGSAPEFVKADESTSYAELDSFERARNWSYNPGYDEITTHSRDYTTPKKTGFMTKRSAVFQPGTLDYTQEQRFRDQGGNKFFDEEGKARGARGRTDRHAGENLTQPIVSKRNRNRNPDAIPLNLSKVGETYIDPEAQKRRGDALRQQKQEAAPAQYEPRKEKATKEVGAGWKKDMRRNEAKRKAEQWAKQEAKNPTLDQPTIVVPDKPAFPPESPKRDIQSAYAELNDAKKEKGEGYQEQMMPYKDVPLNDRLAYYDKKALQEKAYRAAMEAKMGKPREESAKEEFDRLAAEAVKPKAEPAPAPTPEPKTEPKPEPAGKKDTAEKGDTKDMNESTEPTRKSDDPDSMSFSEMLKSARDRAEADRGTPFGGLPMGGSRPFREIYRTVHMDSGRYDVREDVFDPEMHRTDSEPKR